MARKRVLTEHEEFEIMKLVLDKFLWVGTILLLVGLYVTIMHEITQGMWLIFSGGVVMLIFSWIVIKEFELLR